MKRRLALVCAAVLAEAGCQNMPGPYAPLVQRPAAENFHPYRMQAIVSMSDADAQTHFVQDITSIATSSWRWTGKKPTVRVKARTGENLRYTIDFVLPEPNFRETGPVNIAFLVNDRVLDRVHYGSAGDQHFEKPIPKGWVTAGQDITVGAEVDKTTVDPQQGLKLGMVLVRIGITQ
jgi:hypothetical protein